MICEDCFKGMSFFSSGIMVDYKQWPKERMKDSEALKKVSSEFINSHVLVREEKKRELGPPGTEYPKSLSPKKHNY